ncbi:hypothetical protein ACOSP7_001515 [Xanthoceras sorbifolium]
MQTWYATRELCKTVDATFVHRVMFNHRWRFLEYPPISRDPPANKQVRRRHRLDGQYQPSDDQVRKQSLFVDHQLPPILSLNLDLSLSRAYNPYLYYFLLF